MYLKNEEYVGEKFVGANEEGQLFRGIFCFVIVGLQESVSFMPETSHGYVELNWKTYAFFNFQGRELYFLNYIIQTLI